MPKRWTASGAGLYIDMPRPAVHSNPMGRLSLLQGLLSKVRRDKGTQTSAPPNTPLGMLERLHSGERPDFCLYLRPNAGGPVAKAGPLSADLEELLTAAIAPLPVVTLAEGGQRIEQAMPDESFHTLAEHARLLCLVPTDDLHILHRLRLLKERGPLSRCLLAMPQQGTLGTLDWPTTWASARRSAASLGIELSAYTPGGWLFRIGPDGKACTFRPIVNPNVEKVIRAIEAICVEMN